MVKKILKRLWRAVLYVFVFALFFLAYALISATSEIEDASLLCIPAGLGALALAIIICSSADLNVFGTDDGDEKNRRLKKGIQLNQEKLQILKERRILEERQKKIEEEIEELDPATKDEKDEKETFVSEYRYKSLVKDYVHLKMKYQKLMEERSKESGKEVKEGGNGDAA